VPGANQAAFFVDANFVGACVVSAFGDYPNAATIGLPNDSISSIRVGSGAQAYVCRDDNFGGVCQTVTTDIPDLSNQPVGNDQISSAKVQQRGSNTACVPGANQAAFFVDINFSGPCIVKAFGDYPNSGAIGLPNDSISSVRVDPNAQAYVCRDDNYGGLCQTITANIADLTSQPIGNDQISSAKVQQRGSTSTCVPNANQASFFMDANFFGLCVTKDFGDYQNAAAIGLPNDSISSVRVGTGAQAFVCRDDLFGGLCQTIATDVGDLTGQPIGNDQISSLRVQQRGSTNTCAAGANQAAFFIDANFQGSCVVRGLGDFANADAIGLPNDSISSIRIGPGTQAYVCRDDNFGGLCQTMTADASDLNKQPIGNDQISSLKVQQLGAATTCVPGANQVSFFVDALYNGQCVTKDFGDYQTADAIGLPNDSITAIRVGTNAQAYVCRDNLFGGTCQTITGDVPDLSNQPVGNDQISSAKVQPRATPSTCTPGPNQAAFFIDVNFLGSCVVREFGNYPDADAIGLPNDSISSIRVGANAQVVVCQDDFYRGACDTLAGDTPDLWGHAVGNDQISSLRVQPNACAPGPNQAAFFVNSNFDGACAKKDFGAYPSAQAIGLPNDSISSIRLGSNAQAYVCRDDGFGGLCQTIVADAADLTGQPIGNDQISSLKVQARGTSMNCAAAAGQAAFYVDANYSGACIALAMGDYPNAAAIGLPNDSISSVQIGGGAQAFVCQDDFFGGRCQTITGNIADLTGQPIGNDQISSLKVQALGTAANCMPAPTQAAFYVDANFAGACVVKDPGQYYDALAIGLANDSISSVRVGAKAQAYVCRDDYYGGQCQMITANQANLSNQPVGNDQISSLKVQARGDANKCLPGPSQVSFFVDVNFAGPCVVLEAGDYPNAAAVGLPNDSISSIKVGANVQAFVCQDDNFGEPCQTFPADTADLTTQVMIPPLTWNDRISSLRVQVRALAACDAKYFPGCANPQTNGFVDLHTHPLSYVGFGRKLVYGGVDVGSLLPMDPNCKADVKAATVEQALGHDNSTHGKPNFIPNPVGPFILPPICVSNCCGDFLREFAVHQFQQQIHAVDPSGDASGAPDFPDWPVWNDVTHQKMWVDWIQRAYAGGLRVMVALAVNNRTLADTFAGPGDGPDDDKASADLQIQMIKEFVSRHPFMEIALSSADVDRIVRVENKLAIVLGTEIDNIGNLQAVNPLTSAIVSNEIDRLFGEGVRYIFPIHVLDNPFGGTAAYMDLFNLSNKREAGHFWSLACADVAATLKEQVTHRISYDATLAIIGASKLGIDWSTLGGAPIPSCSTLPDGKGGSVPIGHQNSQGLTPLGEFAIRKMMSLGMLIDIDHMSQHSADRALQIAAAVPGGGYPLNSGHNSRRGTCGTGDVTENSRTADQLAKIGALHGMVGVGSANLDAYQWLGCYYQELQAMGSTAGAGFGTDTDGLVVGMPPRAGSSVVYDSTFPRSQLGNRTWDYNTDGVAHYGMMFDFLKDAATYPGSDTTGGLSGSTLIDRYVMGGARYFLATWQKAEAQKSKVSLGQ
jgi:hypothetical protein